MPTVPLGTEAYLRLSAYQPETRLENFYMEVDESGVSPDQTLRLQRPGMDRIATLGKRPRGIFQSDNNSISDLPVVVAGDTVYQIDGDTLNVIGTIEDDGDTVPICATSERICFISAGLIYQYDGKTFSQIATPAGELIVTVDQLDSYFLFGQASGTFFWLVPGTIVIDPLNYATAEQLPDGLVAIKRLRDDVFMLGTSSIEVWQATGDADSTFAPAPGRLLDRGCLSRDSVCLLDNTIFFVGNDGLVYRISDTPQRISTSGIEERIRVSGDLPTAFTFTTAGHPFYVLFIPEQGTFVYDVQTKQWSEFSSIQTAVGWAAIIGIDTGPDTLVCDASGGLFQLNPNGATDDGIPFVRLVTGTVPLPAKPIANSSFSLGVGSAGPVTISIRWKDPRGVWSTPRTVIARGDADIIDIWRLGLARDPYRTFEVSCTDNAQIRISGALANESWRT